MPTSRRGQPRAPRRPPRISRLLSPTHFPQAGTGKFVVWIQTPSTATGATIALCDTPVGPCTKQTDPSHIAHTQVGDFSICTTCGANNYLIYRFAGDNGVHIDQLTSDGLDSTGATVDTGMVGEAPLMFGDAATGGTSTYAIAVPSALIATTAHSSRIARHHPLSGRMVRQRHLMLMAARRSRHR
jgi:hypothetical protein